ncbi:site-specific DNA-methyltransferase [Methylobacter sp. BlB1]|uniref:site-specific DNA-methyltransferase n=1 Tax=Methylobacter sp. BlB1 TaxID=2785914 RepID=UPI001893359F|nr:site-specific DNA-methyltransferase [Methylobacter sp. BlB1]MBF6650215.1 site-specific DNA-methyltransferase [Methylobacter sp. BlB1]
MNNDQLTQESLPFSTSDNGVASVEKYEFEPIKGYPMLNWRGKRPFKSTQYYPAQLKELHGEEVEGWRNKIYWGDNLQVMSHLLKDFRGKVDLIYIDPPFDSRADYKQKISSGTTTSDYSTFEEKQYSDIWNNDEYLQFMYERLVLMRELLTERGTIYLHCDWHKSHHLRCLMDEIFGPDNFVNQIVWKRGHAHSDSKQGSAHLGRLHEEMLVYAKGSERTFNQQYTPYDQSYIDKYYKFIEEDTGRRYWLDNLQGPGGASKGNPYYEVMGVFRHWRYSKERMNQLIKEGRIIQTSPGTVPKYKRYLDEMPGRPVQDVWDDIRSLAGMGASPTERLDYPTQKPEELLERVLLLSSNPGDLVFDCFMGSGTTQASALKLGRRFIGADINLGSVQMTVKRLVTSAALLETADIEKKIYKGLEVYNVNNYDVFRNPVEAKDLLIEALEIQKLDFTSVYDGEKDGRMVKIMPVNRIATRADLNELIAGFDYKAWDRRQSEHPNQPVEKIALICMGHEADLKAQLELAAKPFKVDIEVVDILRDKANLEFKRDSEALAVVKDGELIIERFYPMNLLQKLSLQKVSAEDWRELVESIFIDWNYDGVILQPVVVDIPGKNELAKGRYKVPEDAGTIRVKITDLLSESWEGSVENG